GGAGVDKRVGDGHAAEVGQLVENRPAALREASTDRGPEGDAARDLAAGTEGDQRLAVDGAEAHLRGSLGSVDVIAAEVVANGERAVPDHLVDAPGQLSTGVGRDLAEAAIGVDQRRHPVLRAFEEDYAGPVIVDDAASLPEEKMEDVAQVECGVDRHGHLLDHRGVQQLLAALSQQALLDWAGAAGG